jgi:hypothetical protein
MEKRPMNRRSLPILLAASLVTLAACQAGASPSASSGAPSGSAAASASTAPSDTSSPSIAATVDPVPSDELVPFSCEFPMEQPRSVPQTVNIVDVRIGSHDGYDRVVFEFNEGTPEITLDRAEPPFTEDASGLPLEVEGNSFLQLIMRGGTKQTASGTSSYTGPTDFDPGFTQLVDLVEGGDFEAQSTWYLGLDSETCVRVMLLTLPDRLVIDVEH